MRNVPGSLLCLPTVLLGCDSSHHEAPEVYHISHCRRTPEKLGANNLVSLNMFSLDKLIFKGNL